MPVAGELRALFRKWRTPTYMAYDSWAIATSLGIALILRMNGAVPEHMVNGALHSLPIFILVGLVTFHWSGLYNRIWRLASLPDLIRLVEAAILAITATMIVLMLSQGQRWMPTSVPFIQCLVLISLLSAGRLWRRVLRNMTRGLNRINLPGMRDNARRSDIAVSQQRALIVGHPEYVETILRHLEMLPTPPYLPVGILDLDSGEAHLRLRGVPMLGGVEAIDHVVSHLTARNQRPTCIILATGPEDVVGPQKLKLVTAAQTLNLSVLRAPPATEINKPLDLQLINLADLLDRPQTQLDAQIVHRAIKGQRVLITGAGGSIGRELARQVAIFEPSELLLLDCGEFNLYSVEMEIRENYPAISCHALLCSVRQRQHVMAVFAEWKPHFVFHAAALKHVPLVETNVCAGVQTNVLGTCNVADAAKRHGVRAMVQVSTDKAVNPVGVMGATKRLGELYCQALDLEGAENPGAPRFMTVRFGNVLGSSGSLIPLFQRQLESRSPLTVTHPEITRFFMTVHEAVQLILHSTARAMEYGLKRGRIIVLDMGEPVKIIDIARRMIRLAGLAPERDVPIKIVGLRPGEKLYEELFDERERQLPSDLTGVFEAEPVPVPPGRLQAGFEQLERAVLAHDQVEVRHLLFEMLDAVTREAPLPPRPLSNENCLTAIKKSPIAKPIWPQDGAVRQMQ